MKYYMKLVDEDGNELAIAEAYNIQTHNESLRPYAAAINAHHNTPQVVNPNLKLPDVAFYGCVIEDPIVTKTLTQKP